MAVNKVVYSGDTLIDLTNDTVTADTLSEGVTAHASDGEPITGTLTAVQYGKEQSLDNAQKTRARTNIGAASAEEVCALAEVIRNQIEPAEDDIPKVFFGSALPQTKDDTIMSFRYISKTKDISGYCKTKAQGSSSMSYLKKNQTVKLYADAECTEKLKVDFKGWGEQNKFCFKANWIDLTHARNIVSARLWGDVVKSRASYADIPELLRTSPNQGAVDGFPVKVYAGGVYQGRYTINIPKDAWMANMDSGLDTHCILCGENYVSGCFRAEALIDGSDWTDEVHETIPAVIKTRWNEAIRFVMNSTDEEFVSGIGNYFDVDSLIDYYLFGLASCGLDAFGKNQLYMTTDGLKWYATMYDMDSTWGLWWDGSYFVASNYARSEYQDFKDGNGNLLYIRIENLFREEIKNRYAELRSNVLSIDNIIDRFERFTDIAPPYLVEEDYAGTTVGGAFAGIPLQGKSNIQQIRDFIVNRAEYVDAIVLSLDHGVIYSLPAVTKFNGTSDYIDTGVVWQNGMQNHTVFLDFAGEEPQVNTADYWKDCAMSRNQWDGENNDIGFRFVTEGSYYLLVSTTDRSDIAVMRIPYVESNSTARQRYVVRKDIDAKLIEYFCVDNSGSVYKFHEVALNNDDLGYLNTTDTLTIGATKLTENFGTINSGFWTGTFYDCKVWNRPLSDAEINTLLLA